MARRQQKNAKKQTAPEEPPKRSLSHTFSQLSQQSVDLEKRVRKQPGDLKDSSSESTEEAAEAESQSTTTTTTTTTAITTTSTTSTTTSTPTLAGSTSSREGKERSQKRSKKSVSRAWEYFIKIDSQNASCRLCSPPRTIAGATTSNLWIHLRAHHGFVGTSPPSHTSAITPYVIPVPIKKPLLPIQQKQFDNALVDMIAVDVLPFSFVEHKGFQNFVQLLNPNYELPSRDTVTRLFNIAFDEKVGQIYARCRTAQYPSYTVDLWKSKGLDYYCSIGFHWIDDDWEGLHSYITHCFHVPGSHTAQNIGELVATKLQFCLKPNVTPFAGVSDGGEIASIPYTAKFLDCTIHDRCCICHKLNNIIKKILETNFGEILTNYRNFIKKLRQSNPIKELWDKICLQELKKTKKLQKDTPTRWSSTVIMLKQALKVKNCLKQLRLQLPLKKRAEIFRASEAEWSLIEAIVAVLEPTILAIQVLEGDKYPTQSMIITIIMVLEKTVLTALAGCDTSSLQHKILIQLKNAIAVLWNELPIDTLVASLLDPRFKQLEGCPEEEKQEAWNTLQSEYEKLKPPTDSTTTTSSSSISSISRLSNKQQILSQLFQVPLQSDEFAAYQQLPAESIITNVLLWWKVNKKRFPTIAILAQRYLGVPASQADTERSFSTGERIVTTERSSLSPNNVEKLVVYHQDVSDFCE